MSETNISKELVAAYLKTDFIVFQDTLNFTLRINAYSEPLSELHKQHGVDSSALITAFNPFSKIATEEQNLIRQDELEKDLKLIGGTILLGAGVNPEKTWPEEANYLTLGITENEACKLGNKYQQNAIVFSAADSIPHLILLR